MAEAGTAAVDLLLGGRVRLFQPEIGYRVAIDPVLLAASVPATAEDTAVELGSGTGAAALCLAARVPGCQVIGLERRADFVALARRSARDSSVADRVRFVEGDLADAAGRLGAGRFDHVLANPPHRRPEETAPPLHPQRAAAYVEAEAGLADWVRAMLALARPHGSLTLIHRADRLAEVLGAFDGAPGAITIFPLWPKEGRPAKRVIVQARKGRRGPTTLASGLVLHEADGRFTAAAESVLRHGAALGL